MAGHPVRSAGNAALRRYLRRLARVFLCTTRYDAPMRSRFQFSLKTMLVVMLVVAAFFGGMAVQKRLNKSNSVIMRVRVGGGPLPEGQDETIVLGDGTTWYQAPSGGGVSVKFTPKK